MGINLKTRLAKLECGALSNGGLLVLAIPPDKDQDQVMAQWKADNIGRTLPKMTVFIQRFG
jgi:hypothetical protein